MKLIENIEAINKPFHKAVITIGNFDGVHLGHQALFHQVIEKAEAMGGTSVAMTFEPHPVRVLAQNGQPPLITLYEQKAELIARTGIDVLICVPFSREFAEISAHDFVCELLVKKIGTKAVVVGKDYNFGKNREGDLDLLKKYARDYDFEVIVVNWIEAPQNRHGRCSSTKIRELVEKGRLQEAQKLLGRHYQIRGVVAHGRDRGGRLLGFPTANIVLHDELCPKTGVYAVIVECKYGMFLGVANIGYSPTFDDYQFTVEVHILDFNKDIYQQKIRVNFVARIRDEIKFNGIDELKNQITKDIQVARDLLSL